jgi:uncharacterized membrane protein YsdA (DUF1294 family)
MALAAVLTVGYGLGINLWAYALFGIDKRRAEASEWRVRESTLIGVALAGGWVGAKAGQRRFRHKTRKQPFARRLNAAVLAQPAVMIVLVALALGPFAESMAGAGHMATAVERLASFLESGAAENSGERTGALPRRFGPGSGDGM